MFKWFWEKEKIVTTRQVNIGKATIKIETRKKVYLYPITGYKWPEVTIYRSYWRTRAVETIFQKFVDDSKHFVRVGKTQFINAKLVKSIELIDRESHFVTIQGE